MPVKIICGDEIFRIKVVLSFSKLQEVVSIRINKPISAFTLSYEDLDGDRIVIQNDEDLENASSELPVLKFTCSIRERPASAPSKPLSVAGTRDTHTATMTRLAAMHELLKDSTRDRSDDKKLSMLSSEILEFGSSLREGEERTQVHARAVTAERLQVNLRSQL